MDLDFKKIDQFLVELEVYNNGNTHKFYLFLKENRTLLSILWYNYIELNKKIDYHNLDEIHKKFLNSESFRFRLQKNIIRLFSNYLSSLFAVVDYSRKSIKKYLEINQEVFDAYNFRKEQYLKNNFYHKFLQDLRNYSSHITYLKIGSEFSYNIEWSEPRKSIYLSKDDLLKWDQWGQESRSFIESQDKKISLNEILKTHFSNFILFQNWIYLQIFLVDKGKIETFLIDINDIYEKALEAKMSHWILIRNPYLRYITYVYNKALKSV